ncbi:DUF4350 domain-containing protein [Emticicia sp. 21SJ11W-3]|uniref:DUF4350 domain-containing protein n=1 Tax=Emticicia sp. 21SJ11W-3 TaxID=2916755 RepID=UPI0020A0E8DC|nr:DUF4350 domain-containing protein [Emticicia sp. 21SJ11W-3]UTA69559.1 DUF4350 domain-containing protein [Emticicia sp. 21SJ11W-3]
MTKKLFITGAILIVGAILIIFGISRLSARSKKFDKFFTVSPHSYRPYDCKFFYDELVRNSGGRFTENDLSFENSNYGILGTARNSYVVVSPYFYPSGKDIHQLKNFAGRGNTVFIAAYSLSTELIDSLYYSPHSDMVGLLFPPALKESRWYINWHEQNNTTTPYYLWGHKPATAVLDSVFLLGENSVTAIDTLITDETGQIQMLELTCGEGRIFLSSNPILLSNYFLLYKNNYTLFNKIAEKINLKENNIIWDNYYNSKPDEKLNIGKSKVLEVIFKNTPLVWAFYTFLAAILLFILIYYRRIQKPVPVYVMPRNTSETYIQTVSGLYWQQQNHKSIADKVIAQFFEYLLQNYQLHQKDFQEATLEKISRKTGRSQQVINEVYEAVGSVRSQDVISKESLINLYQKINSFYQQ